MKERKQVEDIKMVVDEEEVQIEKEDTFEDVSGL